MFSWILIAFIIAVIFGVIKIDDLKAWVVKMQPKAEELLNKAKNKAAELKNTKEQNQSENTTSSDNDDKSAE